MTLWRDASRKERQEDTHFRELARLRPRKWRPIVLALRRMEKAYRTELQSRWRKVEEEL